jgi:myxalamid-type nonribosomal peptide synthetase MxaA
MNNNQPSNLTFIRATLRQIVGEVIEVEAEQVDSELPLLDLVNSSLALVEGMRRVYEQFGVLVSIRDVLEGQTDLNGLADYIHQGLQAQRNGRNQDAPTPAPSPKKKQGRRVPLFPTQHHVAILMRYSPAAAAAFNESLAIRLTGALDGPALQAALETAVERHESLRMALSPDRDMLEIIEGERPSLSVSPCPAAELDGRLVAMGQRPFAPGEPLFRAELLRLSETDHVLVLVSHALLLDREALVVLLQDVAALYNLYTRDEEPSSTTSPAAQWTAYMNQRQAEISATARTEAESFWRETFSHGVPRLELPADHPRPPVKNYDGGRLVLPLEPKLVQQLHSWAAASGEKLANVRAHAAFFTAFTTLLHRLAGQPELVVGVNSKPLHLPAGQQPVAATETMTPVPSAYDPEDSFATAVQQQAAALARAYDHAHLSLAEIIQLLQLPRDQSQSAIFAAAFRRQITEVPPAFIDLQASFILAPGAMARYDLELVWETVSGEAKDRLICNYSSELFTADTISRWLDGLLELLRAGLADAAAPCGRLPLMSEAERRRLLVEWNQTERPYPRQQTILDLIREQIRQRPDAVAIRFGEDALTYGQLGQRIEEIAGRLHDSAIGRGDRVAILLPRSPDLVAAMLAAWRVGALYVPLDQEFPPKRLAFMLADADVKTTITDADLAPLVGDANLLLLNDEKLTSQPSSIVHRPPSPNDSAYIIYTSGSTGRPKGVEIMHRAVVNCVLGSQSLLDFGAGDSLLAITTVSFDISVVELFMPLVAGGILVLGEDGLAGDGLRLAERIEQVRPTYVQATPSTWKMVLAAGWQGDPALHIAATGESLSRELAEQLLAKAGRLWNLYGPTETTVYATACPVESAPDQPIRIGRPLPNTKLYILDEQMQPVPIGAVGELYIGGDGLARGYWQRPQLTAQSFVNYELRITNYEASPFVLRNSSLVLYKTGDLARYLPNGDVICLGRIDNQVKIHGVRVELGEVEAALQNVPGVRDAVATAWRDSQGNAQLVAHVIMDHVITAGRHALTPAAIRSRLRELLPTVMIPPHYMFHESFPLTASGKVHRAALPTPDDGQKRVRQVGESPATPTERLLAEAWARVLEIEPDQIGRDADFMDLGGHSLLMTPLMVEVRKLFHVSFDLREFFDASTLRRFAALIDERRRQRGNGQNGRFQPKPDRPSEWGRQRMAFLKREAQLPATIAPARGLTYRPPATYRTIFLTGTTGFLGTYLVAELLQETEAGIHCLVRPRRGQDGRQRLAAQLEKYDLWRDDEWWQEAWQRRLHIVDGDVTLPRLGLDDPLYESLAREVDAILHGAAHVNFIYPYEALRTTNVLGLHEIIRFAFHSRIKPVHHLSTAAIWPMGANQTFYEKENIEHGRPLNLGYDESKWVAERCLLYAAERGLPVARYRPGEVGGDSQTGRCVTDHFLFATIKGFLQFGAFPSLDMHVDIAPVDYVAQALVHLIFRGNPLGRAYHLTNPEPSHMSQALTFLRSLGYRFTEMPFTELRDRLIHSPGFAQNALFPYQAALQEMDSYSLELPRYDTAQTRRALAGSSIACPPADETLFGTYIDYLQEIGFIPEPERQASLDI